MKLTCYTFSGLAPIIRPAPLDRNWMNKTPHQFAYRCLPLNIANTHGWEILCQSSFTVIWNGNMDKDAISIRADSAESSLPISHFANGTLTFHINAIFRTDHGINLFATGPINCPKRGITALTGIIETDWAPYTFTMNWMLTEPHYPVRFEAGEPFCMIFPIYRGLIESVETEVRSIEDEPSLLASYTQWSERRRQFNADLASEGSSARQQQWEKHYFRGLNPDGNRISVEHQTKLRVRAFPGMTQIVEPRKQIEHLNLEASMAEEFRNISKQQDSEYIRYRPGFINSCQCDVVLSFLRRNLDGHESKNYQDEYKSTRALSLLQQIRHVVALDVASFYGISARLFDEGIRIFHWNPGYERKPTKKLERERRFCALIFVDGLVDDEEIYFPYDHTTVRPTNGMLIAFEGGLDSFGVRRIKSGSMYVLQLLLTLDAANADSGLLSIV